MSLLKKIFKSLLKRILLIFKCIISSCKIKIDKKNVFLLNTPTHGNLGDHMITMATIQYLQNINNKIKVIEVSHDQYTYSKFILKLKIKPYNILIINGGGYLGDLWENEQKTVFDIINSFQLNNIIIFPQTFYLFDQNKVKEYRKKFQSHPKLTIALREKNSYNFCVENNILPESRLILSPDIALSYFIPQQEINRGGVLLCLRTDKEKISDNDSLINLLNHKNLYYELTDTVVNRNVDVSDRKKELTEKLNQFSKYSLVITDRLHGMIFAYLTNTPCIAFDNLSKKVSGVYSWIKDSSCVTCFEEYDQEILSKEIDKFLGMDRGSMYYEDCKAKFTMLENSITNLLQNQETLGK